MACFLPLEHTYICAGNSIIPSPEKGTFYRIFNSNNQRNTQKKCPARLIGKREHKGEYNTCLHVYMIRLLARLIAADRSPKNLLFSLGAN